MKIHGSTCETQHCGLSRRGCGVDSQTNHTGTVRRYERAVLFWDGIGSKGTWGLSGDTTVEICCRLLSEDRPKGATMTSSYRGLNN